ncbi:MAG: tetratricopeptide repeat protein, partial [Rhizobacter sp.]|nr:tetratricopeptide repeat protein [Chlorobiales bacterium]
MPQINPQTNLETLREQAQALSSEAWAQRRIDPPHALQLAEDALRLSALCEDSASAARSLLTMGRVRLHQAKFDEAIAAIERALPYFQKTADLAGEISARSAIGEAHYRLNRYAESLDVYQQALSLSEQLPDADERQQRRATLLNNLGGVFRDSGRTAEAIAAHTESLRLKRLSNNEKQSRVYPLINLATLYQETGLHAEALGLFEEG